MIRRSSTPLVVIKRRWFAYYRWHILTPESHNTTPYKMPEFRALLNKVLRTFITRANSNEERGSPCLRPLWNRTYSLCVPLIRNLALEEVRMDLIQPIHLSLKPWAFKRSSKKPQSTISKALEKSTLRIRPGRRCFCIKKMSSWAATILSIIHRPLMKAD